MTRWSFGRELNWELVCAPPYEGGDFDSPLEARFAHEAVKYLMPGPSLDRQVSIKTAHGGFRLDFLITSWCKTRVAFECDGEAFHRDQLADFRRDRAILETGLVDVIWRLRGRDIWFRPEDCFWLISRWNAELFSGRGLINLERLASSEAKAVNYDPLREYIESARYARQENPEDRDGDPFAGPRRIVLVRRTLAIFERNDEEAKASIVLGSPV